MGKVLIISEKGLAIFEWVLFGAKTKTPLLFGKRRG